MSIITTPIADGALMKKAMKQASAIADSPVSTPKKRKVTANKKAKDADMPKETFNQFVRSIDGGDEERSITWVDDMLACVKYAADQIKCDSDTEQEALGKTVRFVISLALEFAWCAEVAVHGKLFKAWSTLRPQLQGVITAAHANTSADNEDTIVSCYAFAVLCFLVFQTNRQTNKGHHREPQQQVAERRVQARPLRSAW